MVRPDTYLQVREHLADLTDEQLEARFWELSRKVVEPLVELARTHTSPSIERSVLMRMGLNSVTSVAVVAECEKRGMLAHGAGHIVWRASQKWACSTRQAAERLAEGSGWDDVESWWGDAR
jgi:D-ornithine 4,5-aminomutase subunit alpha